MWLFLIFVAVPLIEISLFVTVGGAVGLWPTLAIVLITAIIGSQLMRRQGLMTLNRLQTALAGGRNPTDPMAQGAMILVAGLLMLTPGFFTDSVGFLLLLSPVRTALIRWAASRIEASSVVFSKVGASHKSGKPQHEEVIDAEYTILDESRKSPPDNPSGWTKH